MPAGPVWLGRAGDEKILSPAAYTKTFTSKVSWLGGEPGTALI